MYINVRSMLNMFNVSALLTEIMSNVDKFDTFHKISNTFQK